MTKKLNIAIKRAYEEASKDDGIRILIDRLWPRGVSKEKAKLDEWLKELSPSTELREWYEHDPKKFKEFEKKYKKELKENKQAQEDLTTIKNYAKSKKVTLIFAAKDIEHSNAEVLLELLEK